MAAPRRPRRITHGNMDTSWWAIKDTVLAIAIIFITSSCTSACNNHGQEQHTQVSLMNSLTSTTSSSSITRTAVQPKPISSRVVKQTSSVVISSSACVDALCSASNLVPIFSAPDTKNNNHNANSTDSRSSTVAPQPARSTPTRRFARIFSKRRRSRIRTFGSPNSIPVPKEDEEEEDEPIESQSFLSPVFVNLPRSSSGGPRFESHMAGNGLIPPPPYLLKRTRSVPASGRSVSHTRRAIARPQQQQRPMRTQGVEVPIPSEHKSQFNVLNAKEGTYRFGYDTGTSGEQSYRYERRQPDGKVVGKYGFLDPAGVLREVNYVADDQGFRPVLINRYRVDMDFPTVIGPIPAPLKFS